MSDECHERHEANTTMVQTEVQRQQVRLTSMEIKLAEIYERLNQTDFNYRDIKKELAEVRLDFSQYRHEFLEEKTRLANVIASLRGVTEP